MKRDHPIARRRRRKLSVSGSRGRAGVRVDGLVGAPLWGLVGVRAKVDVQVLVAVRVRADKPRLGHVMGTPSLEHNRNGNISTHVQLRPVDRRNRPLDCVTRPLERACVVATCGFRRPRHLELLHGRVRASFDDSVELRTVRHLLDELSADDLELSSGVGLAENSVRCGLRDLGAEVFMEVRVLLSTQSGR